MVTLHLEEEVESHLNEHMLLARSSPLSYWLVAELVEHECLCLIHMTNFTLMQDLEVLTCFGSLITATFNPS